MAKALTTPAQTLVDFTWNYNATITTGGTTVKIVKIVM